MKIFMRMLRTVLGPILLFISFITQGKKMERSSEDQKKVDEQVKNLALYQFETCPFCVKVRRAMHELNINIELCDAKNNAEYKKELLEKGGSPKVPCLQVKENNRVKWMYESNDIITYLKSRFA